MKIRVGAVFLVLLCSHLVARGETNAQEANTLTEMLTFLSEHPIAAFNKEVQERGWISPSMPSLWHLDNVATEDEKEGVRAAWEFGRLLATKISVQAARWCAPKSTAEALQQSNVVLNLSDWINGTEGYGNLILGARCLDIAAVGVGHCVIDPDFPDTELSLLLARLRPRWLSSQVRQQVLNEEAGALTLFDEVATSSLTTEEALGRIWQTGQVQALEARNPSFKTFRVEEQEARRGASKERGAQSVQEDTYFDRPIVLANLPFFVDDPIDGPATTVAMWSKKQHGQIVAGLGSANIVKVEALATFREEVGGFPSDFTVEHPFFTGGKAAFDLAWRPHATKETRLLYVTAWHAYSELNRGVFVDEETRLNRCLRPPVAAP